jgi:hypothetical protein
MLNLLDEVFKLDNEFYRDSKSVKAAYGNEKLSYGWKYEGPVNSNGLLEVLTNPKCPAIWCRPDLLIHIEKFGPKVGYIAIIYSTRDAYNAHTHFWKRMGWVSDIQPYLAT